MDPYITPKAAAQRLGVTPETVRRYCLDGFLDYIMTPGGHRRIYTRSLEALEGRRRKVSSTVTVVEVG